MIPRQQNSLVWGLVGAFAFLVLAQTLRLATGAGVSLPAQFGVAVLVWAGATVGSYVLAGRLSSKRSL